MAQCGRFCLSSHRYDYAFKPLSVLLFRVNQCKTMKAWFSEWLYTGGGIDIKEICWSFQVPETLLVDAIDLLNKESVMWSYDYFSRCKNFVWSLFVLPLYFLLYGFVIYIGILKSGSRERNGTLNELGNALAFTYLSIALSFVLLQIFLCFLPTLCHRKKVCYLFLFKEILWVKICTWGRVRFVINWNC